MTDNGLSAAKPTLHRVPLTARAPIDEALVGCTGAKNNPATGDPHAALDITDGDGTQQLLEVRVGDQITLRAGSLIVEQIHPWNPPRAAGVLLQWVPRAHADGAGDDPSPATVVP